MDERIAELRDVITANYEDIRTLFHGLRDGDLAKVTASGWPVWKVAGHIVLSQAADVRVARRLAAGKSADTPLLLQLVERIAGWRSMRLLSKARKIDLLAAWENSFNELFSCINDISAEPLDVSAASSEHDKAAALEYLRQSPSRSREQAATLRLAIATPASTA